MVVEFSFRYGHEEEKYRRKAAKRAYEVFRILSEELTGWTDPGGVTKTAYVYRLAAG